MTTSSHTSCLDIEELHLAIQEVHRAVSHLANRTGRTTSEQLIKLRDLTHQVSQVNRSLRIDLESPNSEPLENEQIILRTHEVQALCERITSIQNFLEDIVLSVAALGPTVQTLEELIYKTENNQGLAAVSELRETEILVLPESKEPLALTIFERSKPHTTDWVQLAPEDFIKQGLFEKVRKLRSGLVEFRDSDENLVSMASALEFMHRCHEDITQKGFFDWCSSIKRSEKLQLLIIDDDRATRNLLQVSIRRTDNPPNMLLFPDAIEALQFIETPTDGFSVKSPTLILLDLFMPGMDGLEFLEKFKSFELCKYSKVFMLTGSTNVAHKKEALEKGATAFLQKSNLFRQIQDLVNLITAHQRYSEKPTAGSLGLQVF